MAKKQPNIAYTHIVIKEDEQADRIAAKLARKVSGNAGRTFGIGNPIVVVEGVLDQGLLSDEDRANIVNIIEREQASGSDADNDTSGEPAS